MLTAYLTTLIIGGSLLALSIFGGGDHEMDHELELEGGDDLHLLPGDVDADGDVEGLEVHGFDAWLPIGSLRFWTFFCAFFGLVGTLLTFTVGGGLLATLAPSLGVGYLSGVGATKILRSLTSTEVGKVLGGDQLVGTTGKLLLPAAPGKPGKLRMHIGDRIIEELAISDEETFKAGAQVMVIGSRKGEGLVIAAAPQLTDGSERDNT